MIDPAQTVAELVLDHSECAEVFRRHRIDFCCRGELAIAAAARAHGVALDDLVAELQRAVAERRGAPDSDPRELSTPALLAHIVDRYHGELRRALPFLQALAAKVGRVHGDHNPKLRELASAVDELAEALLPHLEVEEQLLFPALTAPAPDPARLARELAEMRQEHLAVAAVLERARAASEDFLVPEWACNSYRTLFAELERLENEVFAHVHLENHVLAPRFAAA